MSLRRRLRWPLLIAWAVFLGMVAFVVVHPRIVAPLLSRLVSRNLFQAVKGNVRVRDFRLNIPGAGAELYNVSLTLPEAGGGLTLITVDTLSMNYRLKELLAHSRRLRQVTARGVQIHILQEKTTAPAKPPSLPVLSLDIDQLEVQRGSLEIIDPSGVQQERIPTLDFRGEVHADSLLQVICRSADVFWQTHQSRLSHVYGELTLDSEGVQLRDLNVQLNESEIELSGRRLWNGDLDVTVRGQRLVGKEIEDLLRVDLGIKCEGDLSARLTSRGDSLFLAGTYSGELEGYQIEDLQGRAVITPKTLRWLELTGRVNSAYFSGGGEFDIGDPRKLAFVLEGEVRDVDLAKGLVSGQELPPTGGRGRLTIRHREPPLWTHVTGELADGFIASVPYDSCWLDVTAAGDSTRFDRFQLLLGGQRASLTGQIDSAGTIAGTWRVEAPDLRRLPASWKLPQVAGSLVASGRLTGPRQHLGLSGRVALTGLALAPLRADSSAFDLQIDDLTGEPTVQFDGKGTGLSAGGVPLGSYLAQGSASARQVRLDFFRAENGDTIVALRGDVALTDSTRTVRVADLQVDWVGNHWELAAPATVVLADGGFTLPESRLVSAQADLSVEGSYRPHQASSGLLRLQNFDLGLLNPILAGSVKLSGRATAEARLGGAPDEPEISLEATAADCQLELAQIDSLHLVAGLKQGRLDVKRLAMFTNYGKVTGRGTIAHQGAELSDFWPGAGLDLSLDITGGDWAFLDQFHLKALDRLAGRYQAQLSVTGNTAAPVIAGTVDSEPFNIHWLHLNRLRGQVHVDRNQMVLSDLVGQQGPLTATGRLEVPLVFDLLSVPETPLDGPFLMHVVIADQSDLSALARATNAFIESGGSGSGEVTIAGPLVHPLYEGQVQVRDGSFVLKGLGEIYRDVDIDGTWSGDTLTLPHISGREGQKGTINGTGQVLFTGLELETFSLDLGVDRFLVASIPDLRVLVQSPHVSLTGVRVGPDSLVVPKFTGRLKVLEGRYVGDFSEKPGVVDVRAATVAPDWLADLRLYAPPRSVRIVNRAMELSMSGDVDLVRDMEGLYLRGSMDIDSGRLPVFNNDFKVVNGRLDFSQEVGLTPVVDMEAETTVRVRHADLGSSDLEKITVHVTGTLYEPVVDFSSESGYAREGIERMLLGLSPYASEPQANTGLGGASIAAGLNMLEREIAAGLNVIDTFDIEQVERPQPNGTLGTAPLVGVGKYLGQDLYIKYARGLSLAQADQDLILEYQFRTHLLLQSEIRRRIDELQGDTTYSLDLKYRFEY